MRILHGIASLDPAHGGPPLVVSRLAAAQAAHGHEVHVVTYAYPEAADRTRVSLAGVPGADKVTWHWLNPPSRVERVLAHDAQRFAASRIGAIDVVHLHGVWEAMLPAFGRAARAAGVPYVVTPHGMLDPWAMRQSALKKRVALRLGYRRMLDGAAFLHMLNDDEAALARPLGLRAPTTVVGNGVFLDEVEPLPPRGTFHARHPEIGGRPFVLFLSRLHYKKGLDHLAAAFEMAAPRLPDVRLVVAGPDGGARDAFERQVRQAGLTDRVHLVGPVYGDEKLAALADAGCFCLPSRQEGFSVAITEALACGVPVVISDACHFPEVRDVGAGRVVPLEPRAIADALVDVMSDDALRVGMSAAGMALVRRRYTWPRIATEMVEAYARSASRR